MARMFGGPNGYGHRSDPEGHRVTSFGRWRGRVGAAPLPSSASLVEHAPRVMDQGFSSSCVGHASSTGIWVSFAHAGHPLAFLPSPAGIYEVARCVDRRPKPDGSLPPLVDDGCEPNQAMRGLEEWGIRPIGSPPPDGRNSDVDVATINAEPMLGDLELDSALTLFGEYRIDTVGAQRVKDVCTAIASGFAVCFAAFIDAAFETWKPATGPIGAPALSEPGGEWHYMCALAYRTEEESGKRIIAFRNSWGTKWGIAGDGEGTEDFVGAWIDIYVMAVTRKEDA